ncbi:hypothetical protein C7B77_07290 [Chamaesiphon polymorphus CCALA 037]|uniref:Uncharacterized protein n=2 Tax=Chamaesiphon TaxID=217161 RepID=A0A2T1GJB2_9CYAN|nr:hypothetical protein C7B77_07290 [Chamaesiphon polymorphus CCALA 037]
MRKATLKTRLFEFASERDIRSGNCSVHMKMTGWMSAQMRSVTQKGIAWQQPIEKGSVYWNVPILQVYLAFGADSDEYAAIVKDYLESLPKS